MSILLYHNRQSKALWFVFFLFRSPPSTVPCDDDSFPPLSSVVTEKSIEKPENERSRKRRRRRRQRKRSGSVSSSSSECGEKDRASLNSPGSGPKNKPTGSLLTAEKVRVEKDTIKVHVNVSCSAHKEGKEGKNSVDENMASRNSTNSCISGKAVSERNSSSSTDGASNSPVQSDTDVKVALNVSQESCSSDKNKSSELENGDLHTLLDRCKTSTNVNQGLPEKKESPKPSSWADLFKGGSKPSPGIVIKVQSSVLRTESSVGLGVKKTEDLLVQTIVGVEEDKYAKKFAGNSCCFARLSGNTVEP